MNNLMNLFRMFMGGQGGNNPLNMIQGMMGNPQQMQNNPMFNRASQMMANKSPQEQEQVVRNMCQQMGIDFEQAKQIARQFGMKL